MLDEAFWRRSRDGLLRACDWTQVDDAPLTPARKQEWAVYRQRLRDLPSVIGYPNVPWPQPPSNTEGAAGSGEGPVYP
ncbi:phage tail assembly chaperone [Stenotrophomonas maltophilia]|nr:phage tail assembly chaperone [Stenotrophomonas maltophilia]